jgi:hypothetical protein
MKVSGRALPSSRNTQVRDEKRAIIVSYRWRVGTSGAKSVLCSHIPRQNKNFIANETN